MAQKLSRSPNALTVRNVGIKPPLNSMVKIIIESMKLRPGKYLRDNE
jgi:hypothetical protein